MSPSVQHGVTPDYVPNERTISSDKNISTASPLDNMEEAVWFLMRAAYGQENKVKDFLEAKGIEVFCHVIRRFMSAMVSVCICCSR